LRARHGAVAVEVLAEGARAEPSAEAPAPYWERCVQLVAAGRPRLAARSCIPAWVPNHPWQPVQQLGTRPLGEVLFALDGVERGPLQFAQLPAPAGAEAHLGAVVMARRCTYRRQGAALVLTEVFLDTDLAASSKPPHPFIHPAPSPHERPHPAPPRVRRQRRRAGPRQLGGRGQRAHR